MDSEKPSKNGQEETKPLDIQADWLKVVRAAQAACKGNDGFGIMTITVGLVGNAPVLYEPILRKKLHPSSMAKVEMTPRVAGVLMAFMDEYRSEPVIVPEMEEELT